MTISLFIIILSLVIFLLTYFFCNYFKIIEIKNKKIISLNGGLYFFIFFLSLPFCFIIFDIKNIKDSLIINQFDLITSIFIFSLLILGTLDDKLRFSAGKKIFYQTFLITSFLFLSKNNLNHIIFLSYEFNLNTNLLYLITIFCFLSLMNAYNYIDGINGISLNFFIFIQIYLILFHNLNILLYLLIPTIIFLFFNLFNKSYIGNSGSTIIPFYISILFINLHNNKGYIFSANEIIYLLFLPGLDFIYLFFTRLFNKKSPFKGDKNHFHHIIFYKTKNIFLTNLIYIFITVIPITMFMFKIKQIFIIIVFFLIYFLVRKKF